MSDIENDRLNDKSGCTSDFRVTALSRYCIATGCSETSPSLKCHSEYKNECFDGEIFAMTGASRKHNLISVNIASALSNQRSQNNQCEVYASLMRVKVNSTGLYTYPDIVVVCGKPQFEDKEINTLLNPNVIIEILSRTTEGYDRGDKFEHYRSIDSLSEVIFVSQDRHHVEDYKRQEGNQWILTERKNLQDKLELASITCELTLADIYRKVSIYSSPD